MSKPVMKSISAIYSKNALSEEHQLSAESLFPESKHGPQWESKATYDDLLKHDYVVPLESAFSEENEVPFTIQLKLANGLKTYFATDRRERAPTVVVDEVLADRFHSLVSRIMHFVSAKAVESLDSIAVAAEVKHALLSYKVLEACSPVVVDGYDHDQGLVRLSYYIHGPKPTEEFLVDGRAIRPLFAKYRACNFFHRRLFRQRIIWLPAGEAGSIGIHLEGITVAVNLDFSHLLASDVPIAEICELPMTDVRRAYPRGKGGQRPLPWTIAGLKARLLCGLARTPWVRRHFSGAWVFMDRDIDADDNAEHFYRWVRQNHPEINAWFLLSRDAPDWKRLSHEGFRLVEPGLRRKLLLLSSECVLSSHPDYVFGGFDRSLYGGSMNWRFVFLRHGVTNNDMSHYLNGKPFDLIVTGSPGEHASIVGDDSPYDFTGREVCRSGFPRHDALLKAANGVRAEETNIVLVMPTWRGALSAEGVGEGPLQTFRASEYAQRWGELLSNERLHKLLQEAGMRLVFMPHPNAVPFLPAFDLPNHVEVLTKAGIGIQELFARTVLMVTDYSSVAFEMAYLRRPVIYYHYDFDKFYGGDHNWRRGYYDYALDGFGPITTELDQVIEHVATFVKDPEAFTEDYLPRMVRALPERDGGACARLFERIFRLGSPTT